MKQKDNRPRRLERRQRGDPYRCHTVTATTIAVVEASTLSYTWLATRHGSRPLVRPSTTRPK